MKAEEVASDRRGMEPPGTNQNLPALSGDPMPLRRLLSLLWRSFFLQAAWSYERMQAVGLASALSGEGRRIATDPPSFLQRQLGYFNTNPVLSSYVIGGLVRLEEHLARGQVGPEEVEQFKRSLSSPLAAWGDAFFWAALRPAATIVGVLGAVVFGFWGALGYLVTYNVFHLYYRIRGLSEGYREGRRIVEALGKSPVRSWSDGLRLAGLAALGGFAVVLWGGAPGARGVGGPWAAVAIGGAAFFALRRWPGGGTWWGLAAVFGGLVQAWLSAR
jgi:PTS system mannose-specific IID component